MQYGAILLSALVGAGLVIQIGLNTTLRMQFASAAWATTINFAIGTVAMLAFALVTRAPAPTSAQAALVPWYVWLGGLLGAGYVASTTVLGPKLGAATFTAIVVGAQMLAAIVVDHYGLVGFSVQAASAWKLVGAALIVIGVVIVMKS